MTFAEYVSKIAARHEGGTTREQALVAYGEAMHRRSDLSAWVRASRRACVMARDVGLPPELEDITLVDAVSRVTAMLCEDDRWLSSCFFEACGGEHPAYEWAALAAICAVMILGTP